MTEKMNRRNFLRVAAAAPATLGAGSVFAASTSGTPAPAHCCHGMRRGGVDGGGSGV